MVQRTVCVVSVHESEFVIRQGLCVCVCCVERGGRD